MKYPLYLILFLFIVSAGCKDDSSSPAEEPDPCAGSAERAYVEENGIIVIEPESDFQSHTWAKKSAIDGYLGSGYLVWEEESYMSSPGNQPLTFLVEITTTGTYQFNWRSRITKGTNGTEHNDSWLRFADASDFYGLKGDHIVYPGGSGKSPTPNGASKDGWFKEYMNGTGAWKWQARTSDNDAHDIFVEFDTPGIYTMEISARSDHHAIDRIVLVHSDADMSAATNEAREISQLLCLP